METKNYKMVESRKDCSWGFQLHDGRIILVADEEKFRLRFDEPIMVDGEVTTLNDLKANGKGKEVFPYEKYDINNIKGAKNLSDKDLLRIQRKFKKNGFNVTFDALFHNYHAWFMDMKSGYRDEENGYHLFTPCGCNPLSFRATTLCDNCKDWQFTYEC